MAFDLLIRGGTVVDGTGAPGFVADVAVRDGRIVEIGDVSGHARHTVDADGLTVAPGFIDNHTHYDAQLCWDPWLTPSSWHGVTTAVLGNCGLGVAPVRASGRDIAVQDLVSIEGMAVEALSAGVHWDWETYPQYLDAMRARRPAINVGFLAGLTPLRHYVMGEVSAPRACRSTSATRASRWPAAWPTTTNWPPMPPCSAGAGGASSRWRCCRSWASSPTPSTLSSTVCRQPAATGR